VALAAIQGLHGMIEDRDRTIEELRAELAELRGLILSH
jgi:ribosomal protein L29